MKLQKIMVKTKIVVSQFLFPKLNIWVCSLALRLPGIGEGIMIPVFLMHLQRGPLSTHIKQPSDHPTTNQFDSPTPTQLRIKERKTPPWMVFIAQRPQKKKRSSFKPSR